MVTVEEEEAAEEEGGKGEEGEGDGDLLCKFLSKGETYDAF